MKLISQETTYTQKTVKFCIEVGEATIEGWKHWKDDDVNGSFEVDVDYTDISEAIVDAMTDAEVDELDEVISTIK